jgi:hypothetical protein
MAQCVATPWDTGFSPESGRLVFGFFKRHNRSGLAVQRLENIEKPVTNRHQPSLIGFGHLSGQINLPLVPFEIFPVCPENFAVCADSSQTAYG